MMRFAFRIRVLVAFALIVASPSLVAETDWQVSTLSTRWRVTDGVAGHTRDCDTRACDDEDWERGNLDSAIGVRLGGSRPIWNRSVLSVSAGADLTLVATEYNFSQRDTSILIGNGFLETAARSRWIGVAGRAGLGGAITSDGRTAFVTILEAAVVVPLAEGVELRLSRRVNDLGGPELHDTAYGLSLSPRAGNAEGCWFIASIAGLSVPGAVAGSDRELGPAPFWLNLVGRSVTPATTIALRWSTVSHESELERDFLGTPGNQRSRALPAFGIEGSYDFGIIRAIGAIDTIDWSDDHGLLSDESGRVMKVGRDVALMAGAETSLTLGGGISLVARAEQLWWRKAGIGEFRLLSGISTRF